MCQGAAMARKRARPVKGLRRRQSRQVAVRVRKAAAGGEEEDEGDEALGEDGAGRGRTPT